MCGRIVQIDPSKIQKEYKPWNPKFKDQIPLFRANYNGAPSQDFAVYAQDGLSLMRFGLVPSWSKTFETQFSTINARIETLDDSRLYAPIVKKNRGLLPVQGFYEWKKEADGKQPYFIHLKDKPLFAMACIWSSWYDKDETEHRSFSIITRPPGKIMHSIHDREPAYIAKKDEDNWLGEYDKKFLEEPEDQLESWAVTKDVNRPANNNAALIKRFEI